MPVASEWLQRRQQGEIVQVRIHELTGYMRTKFASEGIQSMATVPIMFVKGQLWAISILTTVRNASGQPSKSMPQNRRAAARCAGRTVRLTLSYAPANDVSGVLPKHCRLLSAIPARPASCTSARPLPRCWGHMPRR